MKNMDNQNKGILLGVGLAVAVGVLTVTFSTGDTKEKAKTAVNRQKAKHLFFKNKMHGSKKTSKVVDKLSDDEVNRVIGTLTNLKEIESSLSDVSADFKSFFSDKIKDTKKAIK